MIDLHSPEAHRIGIALMLGILLMAAIALSGCATTGSSGPSSLKPICAAHGPVIKYNAKNKNSDFHAGKLLAKRIDWHDDVGANLGCPGY